MAGTPSGHRPRRTCVGCRRTTDTRELVRIGRLADGSLRVGRTLAGRGAWLCRASTPCLERAAREGGFARAFRTPVPPERLDALRAELAEGGAVPGTDFVPGPPAARD